jgi:hypothetical protein
MDAAYISAISALAGSVIGGLTTGFTTLLTQRSQARAGMVAHDLGGGFGQPFYCWNGPQLITGGGGSTDDEGHANDAWPT